jgi:hypothetical protein
MWTEIKEQSDIDKIMELYGNFHDSCLRDIYISTREFVDEKRAMHFDNKLTASLLFQRQFKQNTVLELKFEDIDHFNFNPLDKGEYAVILDATLITKSGLFYWADFAGWEIGDNEAIWISGKKLFWRLRPELIGNLKRINDE